MQPKAGRPDVVFYHTLPIALRQSSSNELETCHFSKAGWPAGYGDMPVSMPSGEDHAVFSQLSAQPLYYWGKGKNKVTLVPLSAFSIGKNQISSQKT